MDEWLLQLEQMTEHMIEQLDQADSQELSSFITRREEIIGQMKQTGHAREHTEAEKQRMRLILQYDERILKKLEELKGDAQAKLSKIRNGKTQKRAYYAGYTRESAFIDKRK